VKGTLYWVLWELILMQILKGRLTLLLMRLKLMLKLMLLLLQM
jgi:hypothetical protein